MERLEIDLTGGHLFKKKKSLINLAIELYLQIVRGSFT